jgi:hypothetical protein
VQFAGSRGASPAALPMVSQVTGGVGQTSPAAVLSAAGAQGVSAAAALPVSCQDQASGWPDGGPGGEVTPPLSPGSAQGGRGSGGVSLAGLVSPLSPSGWRADAAVAAAAAAVMQESVQSETDDYLSIS